MKVWGLGAAMLLAVLVAGCGGNSTTVGIAIGSTGTSPLTVLVNSTAQFEANVTGISTNTVYWQICKETLSPPSTTVPPTDCTQGQGPTTCTIPKVSNPLTGFGTILQSGLYTAPAAPPSPDAVLIVATSCVRANAFTTFIVIIDSGIRVAISPTTATIGTGETFQFTATVTPNTNPGVAWSVCQPGLTNCNMSSLGTISPSGLYTAPTVPQSVVIQAISSADPNQSSTVNVTVVSAVAPTIVNLDPTTAAQGSVQQDVYVSGADFLSTSSVVVGGVVVPSTDVTTISTTLLRVTIPAAQLAQAGPLSVSVQSQNGGMSSGTFNLTVNTVRPALIESSPDSVSQNSASTPNVILTGGFFAAGTTTATFNGQAVPFTVNSSRQLFLSFPAGSFGTPGLYPLVVQNATVAQPAALNLAVTPTSIPGAASGPIGVGASPSAVAIDEADGTAVIANTGSNSISIVSLPSDTLVATIPVGDQPTGVAVDDLLAHPVALVVNSVDQTVTAIDLATQNAVTLSVLINLGTTPPVPYSIGVNPETPQPVPGVPVTHRAIVAYQSTNEATILDVSVNLSLNGGTPVLSEVQQIGGSSSLYSTGPKPAIAIDPSLNWAVVTPGGAGSVNLVDLGRDPVAGVDAGRAPQAIASLSISPTVQGVGINSETHEALLTDPTTGTLYIFSLLDQTVSTVFENGAAFHGIGVSAASMSQLENVGIAVNGSTAVIVGMENGVVLQTVTGLGSSPLAQAVAADPVTNQAVVVNQGDGTVSIVSLGTSIDPLQIVEATPGYVFGGPAAGSVTLTLNGLGFSGASQVLLNGTAIPIDSVSANGRQIVATVPAGMLVMPLRYVVQVQNTVGATVTVSNVTELTVVQPVTVGSSPLGVAVDTDRDLAVVTNSGDGTASLVALTPQTPTGINQTPAGAIGTIGSPITVGTTPAGVAVLSRIETGLSLAVVANNGSNDATVIDVTQTLVPVGVSLCSSGCSAPVGVAINPDTGLVVVTDTNPSNLQNSGEISLFNLPAAAGTAALTATVDPNPVAVAIDPNPALPYAAVASASSASAVDFVNTNTESIVARAANLENPTGIVFDPVNQVFLTANSLLNEVVIIDPATTNETFVRVGIGPSSIDYNFQASTLVTVNSVSHTMSVMAYVCPPSSTVPVATCFAPQVRTVLGLGGAQTSTPLLGPNSVAIDPKLNLAVLVDEDNNRVLLVPLPF